MLLSLFSTGPHLEVQHLELHTVLQANVGPKAWEATMMILYKKNNKVWTATTKIDLYNMI